MGAGCKSKREHKYNLDIREAASAQHDRKRGKAERRPRLRFMDILSGGI